MVDALNIHGRRRSLVGQSTVEIIRKGTVDLLLISQLVQGPRKAFCLLFVLPVGRKHPILCNIRPRALNARLASC